MSPKISVLVHTFLLAISVVSIALLSRKIWPMVLSHTCDLATWQTSEGIMVCRLYKAMYAFMILSAFSLLACAGLDVAVLRQTTSRGAYREMRDGAGASDKTPFASRGAAPGAGPSSRNASPAPPTYRRGFSLELKDSPDLSGASEGDMGDGQRLVAHSPEPGYTPYNATPRLS